MKKESTTTKQLVATLIIAALIIATGVYFFTKQTKSPYEISVFESENGWGYQIATKGKVFIYQPYIPAIEGNNPFPTKETAKKTGELVVKKLKNKEHPALTQEEVKEILKN